MYLVTKHKRMLFALCLAALVAIMCSIFLTVPANASMNISESQDGNIRIITGEISPATAYTTAREEFLEELSESNINDTFSAVVPLDDYYSVAEITELAQDNDLVIERVFMWAPGETGKLVLNIENNDIDRAIERYLAKLESRNISDAMAEDLEKLSNGTFGIYALTIPDSPDNLLELSTTMDSFAGVDVLYNPAAEQHATSRGQTFSYVELPTKPDGQY